MNRDAIGELTKAQARYLDDIRRAGEKRYNGRARRTIEILAAKGFVEYDFDLVPHGNGKWTERFTVRPIIYPKGDTE